LPPKKPYPTPSVAVGSTSGELDVPPEVRIKIGTISDTRIEGRRPDFSRKVRAALGAHYVGLTGDKGHGAIDSKTQRALPTGVSLPVT
jgi:hypothetical protein